MRVKVRKAGLFSKMQMVGLHKYVGILSLS